MQLNEHQHQQVEAIASLVTQTNPSAIRQGVELAAGLGDQAVFAELLDGLAKGPDFDPASPRHRRYPTPERATRFDSGSGNQAWLGLAMLHLLAASDLPLRETITSISLGMAGQKLMKPPPALWIDGLERLSALTHLDLYLTKADNKIDLRALERFPSLTHLRIRGGVWPGPVPSMQHLEELNTVKLELDEGALFPELRYLRGQIASSAPLTPKTMPKLVRIEARGGLRLEGFETLEQLWCDRGEIEVLGCRHIEHLRVSTSSFHAPDLREVGLLDRLSEQLDLSTLDTLREVALNRTTKLSVCNFPKGTKLANPKVQLFGRTLTDLGNLGELEGMEFLAMTRVMSPVSLETLRNAKDLRTLDIRRSPGITDLSPLAELPNLEFVVLNDSERFEIPEQLVDKIRTNR